MSRMKSLCTKMTSVNTMETIDAEVGDIVGQASCGSRLRNLRQVTNARRVLKLDCGYKAHLAETMEMCKTGLGLDGTPFVRCVQAAPEPMCILALDRQLDEMIRNCTDPANFVPIGVDPTFKLGDFFVTPIVFPLRMMVSTDTGKSPVYLGPILIHQTQKFSAYHYLSSQIVALRPELKNIQAIGTDGEAALYNALKLVFPSAVHLRCFIHFKKNIEAKLHSLNFPADIAREIIRDIFGVSSSQHQELGLVDSPNESEFRQKLEAVKSRWDQLELNHRLCRKDDMMTAEFHRWFLEEKSEVMIACMIADVRKRAGMGCNPDHFYTNSCESMNSTIKNRTDFKPHDVRPFVEKMLQLVESQESLLRKAVIRNDRWRFRTEYKHLEVDQDKWFSMSIKSQKHHLTRVYSESLEVTPRETSTDSNEIDSSINGELAVSHLDLINPYRITTSTLEDIWTKAKYLVSTPDLILAVPGQSNSNNRMVASVTDGEPHYVVEKNGKFSCSGKCPRFGTYKICQHVVAAAQNCGLLSDFSKWWKSQKTGPNVDVLAMVDVPKGAGQKGGVPKRGRRGSRRGGITSSVAVTPTDRVSTESPRFSSNSHASNPTNVYGPSVNSSDSVSNYYHSFNQVMGTPFNFSQPTCSPHFAHPTHSPWAGTQTDPSPYHHFSPHGMKPFYLKMLTKQIRVCAGCRLGFNNTLSVPDAPYNMCVAHEEPYVVSPQTSKKFTTKTVVHYHANPDCIWMKEPQFDPCTLEIPSEIYPKLIHANKAYIAQYFNKIIP